MFIDSEGETWNMNPELLEKAIVPVALYGMLYHIDKILAIAEKYG